MTTCLLCGQELTKRQQKSKNKYCSSACALKAVQIRKTKVCEQCGKSFQPKNNPNKGMYCSRECYFAHLKNIKQTPEQLQANKKARRATEHAAAVQRQLQRQAERRAREAERAAEDKLSREKACAECGATFHAHPKTSAYCSEACRNRHKNRVREIHRRHKLRINGRIEWDITLEKLIKRDKNVCHICGKRCDKGDYTTNAEGYFIAGGRYPSIDHVLPVDYGGTHTWDNVKLAHMQCNASKSNSVCYSQPNGQMAMGV